MGKKMYEAMNVGLMPTLAITLAAVGWQAMRATTAFFKACLKYFGIE